MIVHILIILKHLQTLVLTAMVTHTGFKSNVWWTKDGHTNFLTENAGIVKTYEAVTEYCGFSFIEAGKTMGLFPYGRRANIKLFRRYFGLIR